MRNKLISLGLAAGLVGGVALLAVPTWAQAPSKGQSGCINQVNKGTAKVAATQGKENSGCIKNGGKGKLTGTAEACLTADGKGKVGKAKTKNTGGESKKCVSGDLPTFGYTSAANGNTVAVDEEINLLHDIYGPSLDAAIIDAGTDKAGAGCQAAVVKAYEKLAATKIKQFLGCKKAGLAGKTAQIASTADLKTCLEGRSDSIAGDSKGKVGKAKTKLGGTMTKKCGSVNLDAAFPGACVGASNFADCVDERVECRVCLLLNALDGLAADCDAFDDGVVNNSCPPPPPTCGNGVLDLGEACDATASAPDNECGDGRPGTALRTCNSNCTCTCPTRVEWEGNADLADLDTGWTGLGHNQKVVSGGVITFGINCSSTTRPCGVCTVNGPLQNEPASTLVPPAPLSGGHRANNHRCTDDTSVECTTDADCTPPGTCEFYYGSYLPLIAGGVSTCVSNQVDGPLGGTVNVEDGSGNVIFNIIADVFLGSTTVAPCPTCGGDVTPGDGVRDGTCSGGARDTQSCDVSGVHPNLGDTSFDCPPPSGALIATLKIDLTSVTDTITRNITAASPDCTAVAAAGLKCMVDTCAEPGEPACFSDADCTTGTCGGLRCSQGPDSGTACTLDTDCRADCFDFGPPIGKACSFGANAGLSCTSDNDCPGLCGHPGEDTRPNACTGGAGNCLPEPVLDEGTCSGGPATGNCTLQPWILCTTDVDCQDVSGDTCTGSVPRPCFTTDGTTTGDTDVFAVGNGCGPHPDDLCSATAASLFGIGFTQAPGVNTAAGLPGLGRLRLPGTAGGLP